MNKLSEYLAKSGRRQAIKLLKTVDPAKLEAMAVKGVLPAFRRAAEKVPAYKKILAESNVDIRKVVDIDTFKNLVPVISKRDVFPRFDIEELCAGGSIKDMKLAMSSSGFSGVYSFGINTHYNQKTVARSIDTALDYVFDISGKKTFLISCIPMGVHVNTSLKISENSARSDMALAIIKKFCHKFDQTIIVADPSFLKKLVEEGNKEKIAWRKLGISLISGEDWFSDSFRQYLAHAIDINPDSPGGRLVGSTMGVAELDLNLFHESAYSVKLRHMVQQNPALCKALFGEELKAAPIIFHYYPHRIFLEVIDSELIFSMLSPHMLIPLIRYNSRDRGWILPYAHVKKTLQNFGYPELIPDLHLPMVAVGGRNDRYLEVNGIKVYPEEIKQGLYEDFAAAELTTGYFKLNREAKKIEIQLQKGLIPTPEIQGRFNSCLLKYAGVQIPVEIYPYQSFPYGMELDYERKFNHI